jgi:hypothetical protein
MPRARAHLGDQLVWPSALHGAAWLSLWVLASPGCSLSGGGTGEHVEDIAPTEPSAGLDADVAAPGAQRDAGLDARVLGNDGGLDAALKPDAAAQEAGRPPLVDAGTPTDDDAAASADDAGARVDAALPVDAGVEDAGRPDTGVTIPDAGAGCSLADLFALRIDLRVEWEGTSLEGIIPVLAPGTGVLSLFASLDMRSSTQAVLSPCGTIIPDFAAGNNSYKGELYSVYVPDAAWESQQMPRWPVSYGAACEQPGCAFRSDPLLALLGARAVPATSNSPGVVELADHDGDGLPSLTLLARGPTSTNAAGKPYAYPPLFASWIRARKMMLAIGINGQLQGRVSGCGTINGVVNQPVFEQGAVACTGVVEGNPNEQTCNSDFVSFLDDNMPQWTVMSASFKAQRIGTSSCVAVRSALP